MADIISSGSSMLAQPGANSTGIQSLKDFTNLDKMVNPADVKGLTGGLSAMSSKFGDMGASFKSPADAKNLMNNIEIPSIPSLDAAGSLSKIAGDAASDLGDLVGSGRGPMGLPNIKDFMQAASGGPEVDALNTALASGDPSAISSASAALETALTKSQTLLENAGIDIDTPAPKSLGSVMSFGQGLHKLGANTTGSGITGVLKDMATNDKYGDAIKASLAEGKNKALMSANGIKPLDFSGGNPFSGLPSAGSDNSLNAGSSVLSGR